MWELMPSQFPAVAIHAALACGLDSEWVATWRTQDAGDRATALLVLAEALANSSIRSLLDFAAKKFRAKIIPTKTGIAIMTIQKLGCLMMVVYSWRTTDDNLAIILRPRCFFHCKSRQKCLRLILI
jgi:hypothetical protein